MGKEARFEMETTGISKGDESKYFHSSPKVSAFYVALKGYEIRDIESWSRFVDSDSAVAASFDEDRVSLVEQAANETDTEYYIASTVDEARSLLVADWRRLDKLSQRRNESAKSSSIQVIETRAQCLAEESFKAGKVVVALCMEDKENGLSGFWQSYHDLEKRAKNPEDEA